MTGIHLIKVSEAAKLLRMSSPCVYRLARLGIIPSVRIGKSIRFDINVLEDWIKKGGTKLDG